MKVVLYSHAVQAGFPSPADDYIEGLLSLDEHIIEHPSATYLARATGSSMQDIGIFDKDLLVIDRALEPVQNDVVVVALDGELTCKILDAKRRLLLSANNEFPPIPIREDQDVLIEGVVKVSLRYHREIPC
jgi:DNA polymerase V